MESALYTAIQQVNYALKQVKELSIDPAKSEKKYSSYQESKKKYIIASYERNVEFLKKAAEKSEERENYDWAKRPFHVQTGYSKSHRNSQ